MKHRNSPNLRSTLLALCLAAAFPAAHATESATATTSGTTSTTTTPSTTTATSTAIGTSSTTEAKLSAEFADFLGGEEQASAVVSGLRQGTAFSLDAPADTQTRTTSGTTTTTNTTTSTTTDTTAAIDPPTGTMGYGNVRITLRLAQAQLSKLGITQPTTEELSAVLLGGDINGTQVDGILTMRADGMGWGQIAREYGMTVGQLMGKGTGLTKQTSTATTTASKTTGKAAATSGGSNPSGKTTQARSNGYIPSGSGAASASSGRANGYIPSGGKSHGAGIVTAGGSSMGAAAQGNGKAQGQSHKITASTQGAGVVSAAGQHVSMAGGSNAGGKGMAPGQAKKN